jgi:fatty acid desaturase
VAILTLAWAAGLSLLWLGSHAPWPIAIAAAFAFALVHMTPFCLLHEAVHGVFSPSPARNRAFGVACAMLFPTSYTLQRTAHLSHHRRNRTDTDLYDYYLAGQSKALRDFWLIGGNLMGLYWICIPISNLVYLLAPWIYTSAWFREGPARALGFESHVREIAEQGVLRIWLECALACSYHVAVWVALDLDPVSAALCYGAFALHWSALQYVDHAFSPRHVVHGAWNLKVGRVWRACALNYHDHLAHHRFPGVPWRYLPRLVDSREPRPTFWEIYWTLWRGTRPAPALLDDATYALARLRASGGAPAPEEQRREDAHDQAHGRPAAGGVAE